MKTKIVGYYSVFLGISVIAMWIMILLSETIPEGKTELTFHLVSEFIMAVICLVSGIFLLKKIPVGAMLNSLGLGMVIYAVLNAAGYYGERGDMPMMSMFIGIFIMTLIAIIMGVSANKDMSDRI